MNHKVYLFGAGNVGKKVANILSSTPDIEIQGFIDNNKTSDSKPCNYKVYSIEEVLPLLGNAIIIITTANPTTIAEQLRAFGITKFYTNYFDFLKDIQALPATHSQLSEHDIFTQWWYYSIELLPELITKGQHKRNAPMLSRLLLRNASLKGTDCLDIGSMECLIPTLMVRGGAKYTKAVDAIGHCAGKISAVKHYYDVDFDYQNVGLMYDLDKKIQGCFDMINCSGLLYHVISPYHVLAGIRPLLKKNGLIIVSTNVINSSEYRMEFNNHGRFQEEANTFWYITIPLLEYMLKMLKLKPIDCLYYPHDNTMADESITKENSRFSFFNDKPSGYLSVVCRAVDTPDADKDDDWMKNATIGSWEYLELTDWTRVENNPTSDIKYTVPPERESSLQTDLLQTVNSQKPATNTSEESTPDTHVLKLADYM